MDEMLKEFIKNKESFVLATILEKSGSGPREKGSSMIIRKDFSIVGTIGGGAFEYYTIKEAEDVFKSKNNRIKYYNLENDEASILGMACGGSIFVLIEYIDLEEEDKYEFYCALNKLIKERDNFVLISQLREEDNSHKWLCTNEAIQGEENKEIDVIYKDIKKKCIDNIEFKVEGKYLIQPILAKETIYIFGAGHISHKLAKITKFANFNTVILDDREEFANKERFNEVDEIIILDDYKKVFEKINIDRQSYIVIVTRGHLNDKTVLCEAIKTKAKYIGMIGSKIKIKKTFDDLLNEGVTKEDLQRVYSPIGISIEAETPEEIAISIAAELIKVRRNKIG